MAAKAKAGSAGLIRKEPVVKKTSIGDGRRKRGSYRGSKAYRGQGKG
jgi:hypothetical protein